MIFFKSLVVTRCTDRTRVRVRKLDGTGNPLLFAIMGSVIASFLFLALVWIVAETRRRAKAKTFVGAFAMLDTKIDKPFGGIVS